MKIIKWNNFLLKKILIKNIFQKKEKIKDFEKLKNEKNKLINELFKIKKELFREKEASIDSRRALINILHDINEEKDNAIKFKKMAESSAKAKSDFLAVISHEIRTPMNAILGFLQLLEDTKLSDSQKNYIDIIDSSTEILLKILNDVLDVSKFEEGNFVINNRCFNIQHMFEDIVALIKPNILAKNIKFEYFFKEDIPVFLEGDVIRLKQICINLLTNSLKFTDKGKIVFEIGIERNISETEIELFFLVKDTGIGISEEKIKIIFNPFMQSNMSIKREVGGTGLGLYICNLLIKKMDGNIAVESEEQKGTEFKFYVKFYVGSEESEKNISKKEKEIKEIVLPEGMKILAAEDNPVNQKFLSVLLKQLFCIVDIAENGKEALELAKINNYDLILMDIQMPIMSGYEATKKIREEVSENIPIIALTAAVMVEDEEAILSNGMDDFLFKPIKVEDLREKINKWISVN